MARIEPGATIGIIGGGQLGRMLAIAAARLGYRTHVFTPETDSPAQQVASQTTIAAYDDIEALRRFADDVAVVTYEFENIPHASLAFLEQAVQVSPSASILRLSQHRGREKQMLVDNGIAIAPYRFVTSAEELEAAVKAIGVPGVLKTAELGYDGKGQIKIDKGADSAAVWAALGGAEAVYEAFIPFECEVSVIVARNEMSGCVAFPTVQNVHRNHILNLTVAPAPIDKAIRRQASAIARSIAEALDLRGLLAVEMFVTRDGDVLVNELAPRPHNSGHWTIDACVTSQFEQAVRAVCGLPLGSTRRLYNAVMKNLIGDEVHQWYDYLQEPNTKLHLYGKKEVREGRKMGHITRLGKKAKPAQFHWSAE
jgi:5-(carboxyamino)imidazole ribonucleotide synthase